MPGKSTLLAAFKPASEPTIRALSAKWRGPRFQQDLTAWAAATEVQVPTLAKAARQGLQAAAVGQDSANHRRFQSGASDWNLGFRGEALHSSSQSSVAEPGEGQMGDVR